MVYDTVIIGGGAAGLAAAIYNGRYGHSTIVIKGDGIEGSTLETWAVENYPGILKVDGPVMVETMEKQAKNSGAELVYGQIKHIAKTDDIFTVHYEDHCVEAKTVIYATGMLRRKLGLPKEDELRGKGVCYCATCDGPLFRGKTVGVVGGGDSAAKAALILADYSEKVYLIAREGSLTAEPINIKQLEKHYKIKILFNSKIQELIDKNGMLSGVKLADGMIVDLQGLFIEIGGIPNVDPVKELKVELDNSNYIKVDSIASTNVPGFFAAGDVTNGFGGFRQIITAAAGGSVAAYSVHNYLTKKK